MSNFRYEVPVRYPDGATGTAIVLGSEDESRDGIEVRMSFDRGSEVTAFSERSVFDAVCMIRKQLELEQVSLLCFAADEAVYPSPMQESMGPNCLAYRNRLGCQALKADIVDIFDSDASINPVSVEKQAEFHRRWFESL